MISAELLWVAFFFFQKFDHADVVCLGQVALRKASALLNFAALYFVTFNLAHHSISDLLPIEKGELMRW
jgi:hypothetical protein